MAHTSEATIGPTAAELIKLKDILDICTGTFAVPDVGKFSIRPDLSIEQHYTFALDRFEKTARVFDNQYYEEEVLSIGMDEKKYDASIIETAKNEGVPDNHFPRMRRRMRRSYASVEPVDSDVSANLASKLPSAPTQYRISPFSRTTYKSQSSLLQTRRRSELMQPSLLVVSPSVDSAIGKDPACLNSFYPHLPSDTTQSMVSFTSGSSFLPPWRLNEPKKHRRRDSLLSFFRRSGTRNQSPGQARTTPSVAEVPELSSAQSHGSQDLSSLQSLDVSRATSTSSFEEQQSLPTFTPDQMRDLSKKSPWYELRRVCEREMLSFNDFAQHQHVALPLVLGRNRLWLENRTKLVLEKLRETHEQAIEIMENKHAAKELSENERIRLAIEEHAGRNATALKHLNKRMNLLGDDVTSTDLKRFNEELNARSTLKAQLERDLATLIRTQERKLLDLQRRQEKELAERRMICDYDNDKWWKEKEVEIGQNTAKLSQLIEERKWRLIARWYIRLQIVKMQESDIRYIKDPLPLSVLGLPTAFTKDFGYA